MIGLCDAIPATADQDSRYVRDSLSFCRELVDQGRHCNGDDVALAANPFAMSWHAYCHLIAEEIARYG